jgi:hypothetical protein
MKTDLPLFIVGTDDIDVAVFANVDEAEGFMETPDVLRHEYDVYDASGRRAELRMEGYNVRIVGFSRSPDEGSFKERIARFLSAIGHPVDSVNLSLRDFVEYAYPVISTWQDRRG